MTCDKPKSDNPKWSKKTDTLPKFNIEPEHDLKNKQKGSPNFPRGSMFRWTMLTSLKYLVLLKFQRTNNHPTKVFQNFKVKHQS